MLTVSNSNAGRYLVNNGNYTLDFEDVIQEFVVELVNRYCHQPYFRITNTSYIQKGLLLCAHTMLRSKQRKLGLPLEAKDIDNMLANGEAEEALMHWQERQALHELWFHYPGNRASRPGWRNKPGLSLRHCYTALRVQSGIPLFEIAKELGLHASRLSALKNEYTAFFPEFAAGGFIPLGDFVPIHLTVACLDKIGIVHPRKWDLGRAFRDPQALEWVLARKKVCWQLFIFAEEMLRSEMKAQHPHWMDCEIDSDGSGIKLQIQIMNSKNGGSAIVLHDYCGTP